MTTLGQIALLAAFVASGYAAFACVVGWQQDHRSLARLGLWAAVTSVTLLTGVAGLLVLALVTQDLRFAYAAEYTHRLLPWYYAVSALWIGQAGSLLVWTWMLGILAVAYRCWPRRQAYALRACEEMGTGSEPLRDNSGKRPGGEVPVPISSLREPTFGLLMAYFCFLVAIMVFGADPMQPSLTVPQAGRGLNPQLQHPAMLIHPPIVFLGYAGWAIPCAVAIMALVSGQLDKSWIREVRSWALFSWIVLGLGILVGADWAYEELGWGGYWSWDPVENGSLIPWLTGTALIHCALAWQYRGVLKKTAVLLAIATFGLCNFATFLTRSGIFSSLHAFSQSPIGWMFLALMLSLVAAGVILVAWRRASLTAERPLASVWSREAAVTIATWALLLLAAVATAGTLALPLSDILLGKSIVVGTAFYNHVLVPIGLVLLATTGAAPLLRWGATLRPAQGKGLALALAAGALATGAAAALGVRHPLALAIAGLSALAVAALLAALILDLRNRSFARRQCAGFLMHMGLVCLAVGVTGSSLGSRQQETIMREGETTQWAGYSIHFARLVQRSCADGFVAEAQLEISSGGRPYFVLRPAQRRRLAAGGWSTDVAIHSTWYGDFYTILHNGEGADRVRLTFIENPLMRWMWLSGVACCAGGLIAFWPARRRAARPAKTSPVPPPAAVSKQRRRTPAAA